MGGCISSSSGSGGADKLSTTTVHVISLDGQLRQYYVPVTVSDVLQSEAVTSLSSSSCFVCNSDGFNFDDYIESLKGDDELEGGQMYFVLPESKLQYKVSWSDMAGLAVKASIALHKTSTTPITTSNSNSNSNSKKKKVIRRRNKRISPVILNVQEQAAQHDHENHEEEEAINNDYSFYYYQQIQNQENNKLADANNNNNNNNNNNRGVIISSISRSRSMRKLQRCSSNRKSRGRAKMGVGSFRLSLSTIYEGSLLHYST